MILAATLWTCIIAAVAISGWSFDTRSSRVSHIISASIVRRSARWQSFWRASFPHSSSCSCCRCSLRWAIVVGRSNPRGQRTPLARDRVEATTNRTRDLEEVFHMRRRVVCIALLLVAPVASSPARGQERKPINVGSTHGLPFSDGMLVGNTLYVAGQEGDDAAGRLIPGGIATETRVALANVEKILKAAGFEMKNVVSVTVFLADINDFAAMNKIYREVMPDPKPVRSTIQAAALVNNARIEIAVIAAK